MRTVCKMKNSVAVKVILICQYFWFPTIWATPLFNQISKLQFCLIIFEALVVKSFLLVNTRNFWNNPVIKASNHNANCVVNKRNFLLWVWLTPENKILSFHLITFCRQSLYLSEERFPLEWLFRQSVYLSRYLGDFRRQTVALSGYLITLSGVTSKHERNDWRLPLWLVFPLKVSLAFYGWSFFSWNFLEFSRNWGIYYKNTCYKFFAIISFALPQSSC